MALYDEYSHLSAKEQIDIFNLLTGESVNYGVLSQEIDKILAINDEAERNAALRSLYTDMTVSASRSSVIRRSLFTLLEDDFEISVSDEMLYTVAGYCSNHASDDVMLILSTLCREKGYQAKLPAAMGLTPEEKRDMLNNALDPFSVAVIRNEFFKAASYNRVKLDMEKLISGLSRAEDCTWTADPKSNFTSPIAQIYSSYAHAKAESAKHGFFWRVFHPSQNRALKDTVKEAEAFFNKVGFDPEKDGPAAEEYMNNNPCTEVLSDKGTVKMNYKNEINFQQKTAEVNTVPEINVARAKLEEAAKREKSTEKGVEPENSIYKTVAPVYNKYGIEMPKLTSFGVPHMMTANNEDIIAKEYDKYRKTDGYTDYVKMTFLLNFRKMINEEVANNAQPDVEKVLKDAAFVSTTLMNNFTVLYELDELKDIAANSAFGTYSPEFLTNEVVKAFSKKDGENAVDTESVKDRITKVMAEYKNPFVKANEEVKEELPSIEEVPELEELEDDVKEDCVPIEVPEAKDPENTEISSKIEEKDVSTLEKNTNIV